MLTAISGLPATGETTVATALARATRASGPRVDTVESMIVRASPLAHPLGPVGHAVAFSLAGEQLRLGLDVVRDAWAGVADEAGVRRLDVVLVCSDEASHRCRVAAREVDSPGPAAAVVAADPVSGVRAVGA